MMADFNIQLDTSEVDEFNRAMPREIFNATRSAIRTTTTFAEKELEKRMATETKIPLKAFKVFRVHSKASVESGAVWFGFKPMRARWAGKIEESTDGAFAGSYFFRGKGDHYFAATLGTVTNQWNERARRWDSTGGVNSIWRRTSSDRFPVTEGRVNLLKSEAITAGVATLSEQELKTRFTAKLRGYIERRESAA